MKRCALLFALFALGCSKSTPESKPEPTPEPAASPAAQPAPEPAPPEQPAPALLAEGAKAPDFTVKDHNGNDVSLAGLAGKPVVLYWYPKDETPG